MTSDNVKAIAYGVGALAVAYAVYSVVKKIEQTGNGASDAAKQVYEDLRSKISSIPDYVGEKAGEIVATSDNTVKRVAQTLGISSDVGSDTNASFTGGHYVKQLTIAQFDPSTKQFIKDIMKAKGLYNVGLFGFDYSGWKVFDDGTMISPWGEYFMMDYSSPAMDTATGYAVRDIWAPSGTDLTAQF